MFSRSNQKFAKIRPSGKAKFNHAIEEINSLLKLFNQAITSFISLEKEYTNEMDTFLNANLESEIIQILDNHFTKLGKTKSEFSSFFPQLETHWRTVQDYLNESSDQNNNSDELIQTVFESLDKKTEALLPQFKEYIKKELKDYVGPLTNSEKLLASSFEIFTKLHFDIAKNNAELRFDLNNFQETFQAEMERFEKNITQHISQQLAKTLSNIQIKEDNVAWENLEIDRAKKTILGQDKNKSTITRVIEELREKLMSQSSSTSFKANSKVLWRETISLIQHSPKSISEDVLLTVLRNLEKLKQLVE